jgi:predicted transcriptional regulator
MLKKYSLENKIIKLVSTHRDRGILQSRIVSDLGYSRSYISETLKSMVERGILKRELDNPFQYRIYLTEEHKKKNFSFTVGSLISSEYIFVIAAIRKAARKVGVNAKFKVYKNTTKLNSDAIAGKIQVMLSPTLSQLAMSLSSDSISMLRPIATGGSCIIENPGSENNLNLSSSSSTMILMMKKFLGGSIKSEIRRMDDASKSLELVRNGNFRRIAIWEPYASNLLQDKNCNVIASYSDLLGEFPCCFLCATHEFEQKMPGTVSAICNFYDEQRESNDISDGDVRWAINFISVKTGIDEGLVEKSLDNYNFKIHYSREKLLSFIEDVKMYLTTDQVESLLGKD